ncbi:hypothetical protein LLS1_37450 [Leifsonia sp. LS1]|uniref:hypothetical protein n=1 Tax=Leifsonia sp. LS1 TaxID=2828483 RepID=UPI001CFEC530|nr:hypothetical protein [Leifsonia sp. LS1]GIT82076.1 hypothetical protein LLS1_37450 [Leifsonia sp. LS1]
MSDSQPSESNPFTSRRFIVAAVVVGVVLLCAVVLIVSSVIGGQAKPNANPSAAPTNTSTQSAVSEADRSACGLPGFEKSGTLTQAPNTKWALVGTVAAPTDPKGSGPGNVESSGFRSCYAHTPTGSLYAAANMLAVVSDRSLLHEVADKLTVPGPGRDALLKQSGTPSSTPVRYQIAGFKLDSYSSDQATVDIAVNLSTGELVSFPFALQWVDGDWKVKTTDDGGFTLPPAQLQSLGGYIPWSGA